MPNFVDRNRGPRDRALRAASCVHAKSRTLIFLVRARLRCEVHLCPLPLNSWCENHLSNCSATALAKACAWKVLLWLISSPGRGQMPCGHGSQQHALQVSGTCFLCLLLTPHPDGAHPLQCSKYDSKLSPVLLVGLQLRRIVETGGKHSCPLTPLRSLSIALAHRAIVLCCLCSSRATVHVLSGVEWSICATARHVAATNQKYAGAHPPTGAAIRTPRHAVLVMHRGSK